MAVSLRRLTALLTGVALVATLPACSSKPPDDAIGGFLAAWEKGDIAGLKFLTPEGQALPGAAAQKILTTSAGDLATQHPKLTVKGKPAVKDDAASAVVGVSWPVVDGVNWEYETNIKARRKDKQWTIFFSEK